ncbi:MAG: hypothetical protein JSV52_08925 [Candidatus Zixiibacteriota bacterium]|nr:MAG: hypothetical protein JSV52_08925 [candidate division Zixibacteria bacterium]
MHRSWRGRGKPSKKNKPWKNKSKDWNSENEDAFYKKMERQKHHKRQEKMDELEEMAETELLEEAITHQNM